MSPPHLSPQTSHHYPYSNDLFPDSKYRLTIEVRMEGERLPSPTLDVFGVQVTASEKKQMFSFLFSF
jgi:hypothetical protein